MSVESDQSKIIEIINATNDENVKDKIIEIKDMTIKKLEDKITLLEDLIRYIGYNLKKQHNIDIITLAEDNNEGEKEEEEKEIINGKEYIVGHLKPKEN